MKKNITNNEDETRRLGFALAKELKGGELVALSGDLGAGKTKFLQGLAKGLGVNENVNSPTFNILKLYQTDKNKNNVIKIFCHVDAYRLENAKDLVNLGIEELLNQSDVIVAIEWADRVKDILVNKVIKIDIRHLGENKREITIK